MILCSMQRLAGVGGDWRRLAEADADWRPLVELKLFLCGVCFFLLF